ncbi:hypothetical protein [Sphingomonas sp. Leaf242]|uniref:hypothetical protein n=1 Tax=Sphingomonas sp. Leaf242 TaxID=1736304 RepID=UPI000714E054|nr:hypothetical protein [Sphingomonas sp. Leaf242]KQO12475.1 hypothetical protein ASF09_19015 [Sphingomonas sp. Leaf242]
MPADFQLTLSDASLNKIAVQIFPAVGPKLQQTESLPDQQLTLSWAITSPPVFAFTGQDGPQTFRMNLALTVTVTPDGKPPESAPATAVALVKTAIDGTGTLSLRVSSMVFNSSDAFLAAVLNARQADVANQVNGLLASISPTLGIVDDIAFHGFAVDVAAGVLGMAASINGNASNDSMTPPATDYSLLVGQALVQTLVQQQWWNTVPKSYGADGANITLNSYNVVVAGGQILLTFMLSGTYSIGAADWDVRISPVTARLNVSVDANRNVKISSAGTSTPDVSLSPSNWLAYVFDIGLSLVAAITEAIISDVIGDKISGSINSQLDQTLLQVPVLSGGFDGVTITLTPDSLAVGGAGNQLLITGNGIASAS